MPTDAPLRVLVAGADAWARRGLAEALAAEPTLDVVGQSSLSGGLATAIQLHRPDAVVVDPGPVGGASWTEVRGVPVLVLAADPAEAARALSRGAHGAVSREGEPGAIAAALGAIERGLLVVDARFREALVPVENGPAAGELDVALTARELEVLVLLAEGLSNKEIAARLAISAHTAKFHVNAVLTKLDATTRTEAVTRAARHGLLRL